MDKLYNTQRERVQEISADVIVTLEINLPESRQTMTRTLYTSKEERDIAYLIETNDWLTSNG